MRDRFPHPYTDEDADQWVHHCITASPATDFAIDVDGVACGGIGVMELREDVERVSAEIGYWMGEEFWGRGLMTEAVSAFVPWALRGVRPDANLRPRVRFQRSVGARPGEVRIRPRSVAPPIGHQGRPGDRRIPVRSFSRRVKKDSGLRTSDYGPPPTAHGSRTPISGADGRPGYLSQRSAITGTGVPGLLELRDQAAELCSGVCGIGCGGQLRDAYLDGERQRVTVW